VAEDVRILAAGFFQGVTQHSQPLRIQVARWQQAVLVGSLGKTTNEAIVLPDAGGPPVQFGGGPSSIGLPYPYQSTPPAPDQLPGGPAPARHMDNCRRGH
jgi:hypothetical protein